MNTFGVSTAFLRAGPQDEQAFDEVARHGFPLVELVESEGGLDLGDSQHLAALRTSMAATGIRPCSVVGHVNRADILIAAAAALESPRVVLRSFRCSRARSAEAALDQSIVRKAVDRVTTRLEPSGLALALDFPAWRGLGPDAFRELIDGFEDILVGAAFDVGHAAIASPGEVAETAETLSGLLVSVRLHDNNGRDDSHRVPGAGSIDWPAALTACWKTGFTGPWILDPGLETGVSTVLDRAVGARTRLQAILEDLSQPFAFTE